MARITDQNKIERLKKSTMKLVAEKGFGGASASLIAKNAKVATGYFYLHYKGKYEMVNCLLQDVYQEIVDKFEEFGEQGNTFSETIDKLIRHFFGIANADPIKVKFLYVLSNDYSFVIDKKVRDDIHALIKKAKELGHTSGLLDETLSAEDLYLVLIINTIQYINQRYKNNVKRVKFTREDEDHLLYMINKILK